MNFSALQRNYMNIITNAICGARPGHPSGYKTLHAHSLRCSQEFLTMAALLMEQGSDGLNPQVLTLNPEHPVTIVQIKIDPPGRKVGFQFPDQVTRAGAFPYIGFENDHHCL